jgi:hypothetical protein
MKFKTLQEALRKTLLERIEAGQLTGLKLARETGFQQAHISNFLNHKRGLSVEGMDKVLQVQRLSVLDLLEPQQIKRHARISSRVSDEFENVPVVGSAEAATKPRITPPKVKDTYQFKRSFLHQLHPAMEAGGNRKSWQRFVIIRVEAQDCAAMYPRLLPGTLVLIDRHYTSLKPYRKGKSNLYAVKSKGVCTIRYVELAGDRLVLRPHDPTHPVEIIPIPRTKSAGDYLIGRVCWLGIET